MYVILIHGKSGSGKDTLADRIIRFLVQNQVPAFKYSLAWPLYRMAENLGYDLDLFIDPVAKNEFQPSVGMSPRRWLQTMGTENLRGMFGENVFINMAISYYGSMSKYALILKSDYGGKVGYTQLLDYINKVHSHRHLAPEPFARNLPINRKFSPFPSVDTSFWWLGDRLNGLTLPMNPVMVIPDVRFHNEWEFMDRLAIRIELVNPSFTIPDSEYDDSVGGHKSEDNSWLSDSKHDPDFMIDVREDSYVYEVFGSILKKTSEKRHDEG